MCVFAPNAKKRRQFFNLFSYKNEQSGDFFEIKIIKNQKF
jgi:hypothetical protein